MTEEAEVFAGVTEAAARDVEAADFCNNACRDEDEDECGQNQQSSAMEEAQNESKATEYFQPRQIEGKTDRERPGQNLVIINVVGKANRIHGFDDAGINENAAYDKSDDSPRERFNHLTI